MIAARRIAEAQVDLIRVAGARRDIISAAMADPKGSIDVLIELADDLRGRVLGDIYSISTERTVPRASWGLRARVYGERSIGHGGTSVMKLLRLTPGREPWRLRMPLPVRNPSLTFGARAPAAITFAMV